ncbi:hypothetical protein PR048_023382 [Dryococelus australis]|uniref:DDE Tnp4 domain-containing protein n=1 Tax=Dryococelus australis TaxID=614101 RepID=A0ABQ9GTY7_9NEOP|nr:hypothetical protein PR048_023382 [Dryococelus australis]
MSAIHMQLLIDRIGPTTAKRDTLMGKVILVHERVLFVATSEELEHWNDPQCLGVTDGKHIVIEALNGSGNYYYHYKRSHSIVLLAIANAEYRFTYVAVHCNGRISDGGMLANCSLHNALESGSVQLPPPIPLLGRRLPVPFYFVTDDTSIDDVRNTQPRDWCEEGFPTNTCFSIARRSMSKYGIFTEGCMTTKIRLRDAYRVKLPGNISILPTNSFFNKTAGTFK